jgi:hypothetical protein
LIAGVEDAFGFAIPEQDAQELHTLGELHDYVLAHRFGDKSIECLGAMVFHKLRRGMMWAWKLERGEVRTSQPVAALFPSRRFWAWRALRRAIGLRLPLLRRPRWVMSASVLAVFASAILTPWALSLGLFNGAVLVGILTAYAAAHCFSWLTVPLATELPSDCVTVGQLAEATMARNYQAILEESREPIGNAEAWNLLRTILSEHRGIPSGSIDRNTDLRRNLISV